MLKKRLLSAACTTLAAMALCACGDNGTTGGGSTTGPSTRPSANAGGKAITVGFVQTGSESAWRAANTNSVKSEAEKRGIKLNFISGEGDVNKQRAAVSTLIAQGVDVIILDPKENFGWDPTLKAAKAANIPVIIADRAIDSSPDLYVCFIGSNFDEEGKRVGEWLAKKTDGKAQIVEIEGSTGSAAAVDRKKGFESAISKYPGMKVLDSKSGDFDTAKGKQVMESFLKNPSLKDATVVFAHNDDMALGAIQAIKEAGKKPGKDILVVSVDGEKAMVQAIADGDANCTVECKPLLGPSLFDAAEKVAAGQTVPKVSYSEEELFDETNAKDAVSKRQY
jgi:simple sugar transport system substrate-binding protein